MSLESYCTVYTNLLFFLLESSFYIYTYNNKKLIGATSMRAKTSPATLLLHLVFFQPWQFLRHFITRFKFVFDGRSFGFSISSERMMFFQLAYQLYMSTGCLIKFYDNV
ncbi:expressed protein [Phakopsora pachyrhizi]|uniref:Expressed protein n=1 Tax=Phakopsora pachyrhizi TaxID=170000 RepID=A0AAV0AQZ1_PHAPC|nr:expressed protein [Phakopsora pachyrhizi]